MTLGAIHVFPIKSLDGVERPSVRITAGGALEGDRRFALFDKDGKIVNGKRTPRVHQLRAAFSDDLQEVSFRETGQTAGRTFVLEDGPEQRAWLSAFFGFPVRLQRDDIHGFPDDTHAPGPTITSEASLREVGGWFSLPLTEIRRRFRTNLELTGAEPFSEDRLFSAPGTPLPFTIGSVSFRGHNPCQRCAVPARDAHSGEATPLFQKTFLRRREDSLPAWSAREHFTHFYRFAVNTSILPEDGGKILSVGDPVGP